MADDLLNDTKTYPRMAHWFDPVLLAASEQRRPVLSSVFGQYADRRLMIAALDNVPPGEHAKRAEEFRTRLQEDGQGGVWIDWVADLGDDFDSTYAMASLLARAEVKVGDVSLPRSQALVMGGDEVYPKATKQAYFNQLRQPYAWAAPDPDRKDDEGRPLLAIPGNHDWYDGLVLFLALFCKEKALARRRMALASAPQLLRRPTDRDLVALGDRHSTRRRHGRTAGRLLYSFDKYAVGLERVPRRKDWVANKKHDKNRPDPEVPVFVPTPDLDPHLIEKVSIRFQPRPANAAAA